MIEVTSLQQRYGPTTVLDVEHLSVAQGGSLLLLGPSGSGKTTLLHCLAGILRPTSGKVVVAGESLYEMSEGKRDRFRGTTIGLVFQRLHLLDALTVTQNLRLAPSLAGIPVDKNRIRETLERLDLTDKANARPHQLSMGQRQRVAIARAVMNKPQLILADEPTAALDDKRAQAVLSLLALEAQQAGATLIVATHDRRIMDAFDQRLDLSTTSAETEA